MNPVPDKIPYLVLDLEPDMVTYLIPDLVPDLIRRPLLVRGHQAAKRIELTTSLLSSSPFNHQLLFPGPFNPFDHLFANLVSAFSCLQVAVCRSAVWC